MIALLDTPTDGRYLLHGRDVSEASENERARLRSDSFGFIFQNFHLLERRRVADSVELGLIYRGVAAPGRRQRAVRALEAVGLAGMADRPVNTLSGGQRQRVAVARALASAAPVVVADEPTGNLDSESGRQVIEALSTLHKAGATVLLVTHSAEVAAHAQRHVRIVDGRLEELPGSAGVPDGAALSPAAITGPPESRQR